MWATKSGLPPTGEMLFAWAMGLTGDRETMCSSTSLLSIRCRAITILLMESLILTSFMEILCVD